MESCIPSAADLQAHDDDDPEAWPIFSAVLTFPDGSTVRMRVPVNPENDPASAHSEAAQELVLMFLQAVYESGVVQAVRTNGVIRADSD